MSVILGVGGGVVYQLNADRGKGGRKEEGRDMLKGGETQC